MRTFGVVDELLPLKSHGVKETKQTLAELLHEMRLREREGGRKRREVGFGFWVLVWSPGTLYMNK
jgi:hypothetical protein